MILKQNYPLLWNQKVVFELTDTKVTQKWTSLTNSGSSEFLLTSISPASVKIKHSDRSFESIAWFFFACGGVLTYLSNRLPIPFSFALISLGISLIFTFLYFFKKSEYEIFLNNTNQGLFRIRHSKEGEEKAFIEELKLKVSK